MPVRPFIPWPDKRLRTAAEPVGKITDEVRAIWDDMIDTMEAMPGVGLAAPQIGVMLRLAVVDCSTERGQGRAHGQPRDPVTPRPRHVRVGGGEPEPPRCERQDHAPRPCDVPSPTTGHPCSPARFEDLWATSVQHQIDHLNGRMIYADRLSKTKRDMLLRKARKRRLMRSSSWARPTFSVPVLDALVDAGHEIACVYCQPPRPAGRGKKDRPSPVQAAPRRWACPCATPVSLKSARGAGGVRRARCGYRRGRGLWPDPAAGGAGCAPAWLPEHPRQPVAALARGGPDPARDHGGRCGNRGLHHADGGRARHRAGAVAQGAGYRPEETAGDLHDRLSALGAAAIVEALRDLARWRPSRSRRTASPTRPRSTRPRRGSTGPRTRWISTARSGAFRLFPGRGPWPMANA
jgi:peptide deformylase